MYTFSDSGAVRFLCPTYRPPATMSLPWCTTTQTEGEAAFRRLLRPGPAANVPEGHMVRRGALFRV